MMRQVPGESCFRCGRAIIDKFYLSSLGRLWHQDCLACTCCRVRLAQAGSSLYVKFGLLFCARDYMRLFGVSGECQVCGGTIAAFEMAMKLRGGSYHLACFNCSVCGANFCVGDKFVVKNDKLYCVNHSVGV